MTRKEKIVTTAVAGGVLALLGLFPTMAQAANEVPASFTLEGVLYDTPAGTQTLLDAAAAVRVQVLDPSKNCVLYDETQNVNTTASDGIFNIQVGSVTGAVKRVGGSDPGNTMVTVFQNKNAIVGSGGACAGASYTPAAGDIRYVRLIVTPSAGAMNTLSPDMTLGSVPMALVAERAENLQGLARTEVLQIGTNAQLTQANIENVFSVANYPILTALLAGAMPSGGVTNATNFVINADSDANGSGAINFNTAGSTKASISNNGDFTVDTNTLFVDATSNRLGIGTTSASSDLSFGGNAARTIALERHSTADTAGNIFTLGAGGATTGATDKAGGDLVLASGTATGSAGSNIYLQTATPGAAGVADRAPSTKVSITGAGNVGIGTSVPTGTIGFDGNSAKTIKMERHTTADTAGTNLTIAAGSATSGATAKAGGDLILSSGTATGDKAGNIQFHTSKGYVADTTDRAPAVSVMIEGDGDVGIGNSAPTNSLVVQRNYTAIVYNPSSGATTHPTSGQPTISIVNNGTANSAATYLSFSTRNTATTTQRAYIASFASAAGDTPSIAIGQQTGAAAYAERLRIDASGNLGIATTSPGYKLDVTGDLRVTGTPYRDGGDIAWQVPSDARLKDVAGPYAYGLSEIAQLDTIRFHYKVGNPVGADSKKEYIGVLAQQVQSVIPDAVSSDPNSGYLSLNSSPIFWALLNSIKELKDLFEGNAQAIEEHAREIASLKAANAELRTRLERLEGGR